MSSRYLRYSLLLARSTQKPCGMQLSYVYHITSSSDTHNIELRFAVYNLINFYRNVQFVHSLPTARFSDS